MIAYRKPEEHYIEVAKHIYWKEGNPYNNENRRRARKDQLAGCLNCEGYRVIRAGNYSVLAHLLHWWMVYGELPFELDHINKDKDDNRIENLRICNVSQNKMNCSIYSNNKSGLSGVTFSKQTNMWQAFIRIKGKHTYLGSFNSFEGAALNRIVAAKIHYGEFGNADKLLDDLILSIGDLRSFDFKESKRYSNRSTKKANDMTGISYCKSQDKWIARISINKKLTHLGYFKSIEIAKLKRIVASKIHYGDKSNAEELLDGWCQRNYQI